MGGWLSTQTQSSQPMTIESTKHVGNTVVIAVDGSKEADIAFMWYVDHVHTPDNKVHIIHGQDVEYPSGKHFPDYVIPPEEWAEKMEEAWAKGEKIVKRYGDKLKELKIDGEIHSQIARPGHMIVSSANDLNASMIVMGTRGMDFQGRLLFGSVSEYVVHNTRIPVTVVPKTGAPRFHNGDQG